MTRHRSHSWRPSEELPGSPPDAIPAWSGAVLWVALTLAAAVLGALATDDADSFYSSLNLPSWAPPAGLFGPLFGPLWGLLYALMAVAAVMVHRRARRNPATTGALRLYALALLPNALWSWTFFYWQQGLAAMVAIFALWLLLLVTAGAFQRVRPLAALLMLPVTLCVGFAMALNLSLLRLNPGLW